MIQDRIQQIEGKIQNSASVPEETKRELFELLATLKAEAGALAETNPEDVQSIAGFVDASAHEATREARKPELLDAALQGLTSSVEELETSHPKIAQAVNRIAVILSNMGI